MKRRILAGCLRKNKAALILFAATAALNGAVFALYGVMTEAFWYAEALLFALLLALLALDCAAEYRAAKAREYARRSLLTGGAYMPCGDTPRDRDYADMLRALADEAARLQTDFEAKRRNDEDYYTAWVHQIKTPIATMRLLLTEDTQKDRALAAELFRVERYVGMVLDYIRLESGANDLVIREYALDEIIRETLRKFAPQFVLRRLRLVYAPTEQTVITDKKWLAFILEQLIANAVKYTPQGEVRVEAGRGMIRVVDTGIGIAPEDLPRIFEKGYTGANGRLGQRSSGLGLFLTQKAAALIGAEVSCESAVGQGSIFTVRLPDSAWQCGKEEP